MNDEKEQKKGKQEIRSRKNERDEDRKILVCLVQYCRISYIYISLYLLNATIYNL